MELGCRPNVNSLDLFAVTNSVAKIVAGRLMLPRLGLRRTMVIAAGANRGHCY